MTRARQFPQLLTLQIALRNACRQSISSRCLGLTTARLTRDCFVVCLRDYVAGESWTIGKIYDRNADYLTALLATLAAERTL
jgi:hypothetical protein